MSLLSSFVADHLIKALEAEFIKHQPELQQAFLNEVQEFTGCVLKWISEKMEPKAE